MTGPDNPERGPGGRPEPDAKDERGFGRQEGMALTSNNNHPSSGSYYVLGTFLIAFHLPTNLTKQEVILLLTDVPHLES